MAGFTVKCIFAIQTAVFATFEARGYEVDSLQTAQYLAAIDAGRIAVQESGPGIGRPRRVSAGFTCDGPTSAWKAHYIDLGLTYDEAFDIRLGSLNE